MPKFKVGAAGVGQRIDVFVSSKYPDYARSALSGLFDGELVKVNGETAKPSHKLHDKDSVEVDDAVIKHQPAVVEIPVLYEDDDVVVMNKPSGVLTHSKGALNTESTVASFLGTKITDENLTNNRAGIVHRLDRPTSGVIIGAKHENSLKFLQKQFANRNTAKTYFAIVEGVPEPAEAIIDAPIERHPRRPQTFRVGSGGKSAQTHYKVMNKLKNNGKSYAYLELKPVTGRTHQLRVHLNYVGHPIVGDWVYGQDGPAMLLHAGSLELTLPSGTRQIFKAPVPKAFEDFSQK